jgi:hypothetical protein
MSAAMMGDPINSPGTKRASQVNLSKLRSRSAAIAALLNRECQINRRSCKLSHRIAEFDFEWLALIS